MAGSGNTIFVGLGGSTPHSTSKPYGWAKSLASIACFFLGCFFFARLSRSLQPLRRRTLVASFFIQTVIIIVSAAIIESGAIEGSLDRIKDDIDWKSVIPVALLSFQSAGQIVGSRALNVSEIPSVVLTSMIHDIATDPKLFGPLTANVKRNRRILAFFTILIGAVAGGFISESTGEVSIPLWIAAGVKALLAVAWMVWPEQTDAKT